MTHTRRLLSACIWWPKTQLMPARPGEANGDRSSALNMESLWSEACWLQRDTAIYRSASRMHRKKKQIISKWPSNSSIAKKGVSWEPKTYFCNQNPLACPIQEGKQDAREQLRKRSSIMAFPSYLTRGLVSKVSCSVTHLHHAVTLLGPVQADGTFSWGSGPYSYTHV